jgi:hypothetical protein
MDLSHALLGRPGPEPDAQLIACNMNSRSYYSEIVDPGRHNPQYPFRGVRTKRHTYVVRTRGEWLLFDNQEDPYQMNNIVDNPAHAGLKMELARKLDELLKVAEDPYVPVPAWCEMSVAERVGAEAEYYCLVRQRSRMESYRATEIEPYLARAATPEQKKHLRDAAEEVYDFQFFGKLFALQRAIDSGYRRYESREPELRRKLQAHERDHRAILDERSGQILGEVHVQATH